jgi:ATP-binding cassette subfamily C protein/ATP-binding cassette subfamily C protein EexD
MIGGSIILARALSPVEQAILTWRQLASARQAYYRLVEFFERDRLRERGTALPAPKGRLDIERVVYAFPKADHALLKGIGFSLPAGASLALIGASGSGKTTLARILVGVLKPVSGVARLDGADVFSWLREDFGRYVGYLPQDVELFGGSVRENIARLADTTDDEVVKAAQLAGCHEMILRLPQGYDTQIGTGGRRLSGGQRQRVALARALFQEPRFVVLDEPNANLDSDGEIALIQALAYLKRRGATVIVIAHRMSVVQAMDRILVLKDGGIEHYGKREEVLAKLANEPPAAAPAPRPVFPRAVEASE